MSNTFLWILASTFAMSLLAWVGLATLLLKERTLKKVTLPLVAFAAGALLGGAFLHMIPKAIGKGGEEGVVLLLALGGFVIFLFLEEFICWHHCHSTPSEHKHPVGYMILIADGLHNFLGGIAIGSAFLVDIRLGIVTWIVAAAHEIPQEFGDFVILLHSGWEKKKALFYNFLSALTIVGGGLVVYFAAEFINIIYLLPIAAGNFIYIATSDLIPEIKHNTNRKENVLHFSALVAGIALLWAVKAMAG
jgi:zinc and cadmium transporter